MNVEALLIEERELMKRFIRNSTKIHAILNSIKTSINNNPDEKKIESSFLWASRKHLFKILLLYGFFPDYESYISFLNQISKNQTAQELHKEIYIDTSMFGQIKLSNGGIQLSGTAEVINIAIDRFFEIDEIENMVLSQFSSNESLFSKLNSCCVEIITDFPRILFEKYYNSLIGYVFLKWFRKSPQAEKMAKFKGVTYTPRIIAKIMSELSIKRLIHSRFNVEIEKIDLEPPEKCVNVYNFLSNITVCDNACGCGIFLIEMLNHLEDLSQSLYKIIESKVKEGNSGQNREELKIKQLDLCEILHNSIFGVDSDNSSIVITKFLIISELIKKQKMIELVKTNRIWELNEILTKHIIMGDSLIGFPVPNIDITGRNNILDIKESSRNRCTSDSIPRNSNENITDLFENVLTEKLIRMNKDISMMILRKDPIYQKIMNNIFHWTAQFSPIFHNGGFDLIIGNPPYVRQELLNLRFKSHNLFLKDIFSAILNDTLDSDFKIPKTSDLSVLFMVRSLQLINQCGLVSYIITDKWIQRNYGASYRKFLLNHTIIQDLIDISHFSIFSEVNIDPVIIQLSKIPVVKEMDQIKEREASTGMIEHKEKNHPIRYYKPESLSEFIYKPILIDKGQFSSNKWFFDTKSILPIRTIVEKKGTPIEKMNIKIWFGIKTGFNDAFLIDTQMKDKIVRSTLEADRLLKPVLRGRDILPYRILDTRRWLIVIPKGFTIERFKNEYKTQFKPKSDEVDCENPKIRHFFETKFSETFPEIYNHLKSFEHNSGRGRGLMVRDDYGDFWWELRSCAYYHEYEKPKIIWQEITTQPTFYFDTEGYYGLAKTFIMISTQPKVHTLILNSTLSKWMIRWYGTTLKKTLEFKKRYVEKFPLIDAPEALVKYYNYICDILHYLAKNDELKPLYNYFYQISDILVFYLYFSDSDIEVQFRFPCVDSIATLFSIFEQNMAIDYNQELNHKSISNKKNNKKKSNVKDSFLMNITKIKAAIDEFNQKTSFFNIINNWDTFRRLSEVL